VTSPARQQPGGEPDVPVDKILKWRRHPRSGPRKDLLIYVGIPFCLPTAPDRCGFCLFPSEVYQGPEQLVTYLRYLRTEGELYRGWFDDDEVRAVYFGGGTANLFAPEQYRELMDIVRAVCPLAPTAEVTTFKIDESIAPQSRAAFSTTARMTGSRSVGELAITRKISLVAVCCSSASVTCAWASVRSAFLAWSSLSSRAFSTAITAWSANVWTKAISADAKPPTCFRVTAMTPTTSSLRSIGIATTERKPRNLACSRYRGPQAGRRVHGHQGDLRPVSGPGADRREVALGRTGQRGRVGPGGAIDKRHNWHWLHGRGIWPRSRHRAQYSSGGAGRCPGELAQVEHHPPGFFGSTRLHRVGDDHLIAAPARPVVADHRLGHPCIRRAELALDHGGGAPREESDHQESHEHGARQAPLLRRKAAVFGDSLCRSSRGHLHGSPPPPATPALGI
jgi:hypothetical protein